MAPRTDMAVFLDLEATGSDDHEEIVEVGIVAVRLPSFEEISVFQTLVIPSTKAWDAMKPVVVNMHQKSGLTQDLMDGKGIPKAYVDSAVIQWLEGIDIVGKDTTHIPLGGSGVSHYDRKYIKRDLPRFDKRLTYWALDSGVLRRAFRIAGVQWLPEYSEDTKPHRALDDARLHAREFKYALDCLRKVAELVPDLKVDEQGTEVPQPAGAAF